MALIFYKMAFIFYIKMAFIFYILEFTKSKITECKTACKTVPCPKLCTTWTLDLPGRDSLDGVKSSSASWSCPALVGCDAGAWRRRWPAFDDVKSASSPGPSSPPLVPVVGCGADSCGDGIGSMRNRSVFKCVVGVCLCNQSGAGVHVLDHFRKCPESGYEGA